MLTSRLLANIKIISELTLSRSFSSSGKYHVIKILNSENKYLYGNLIETQKQRRRKITKTVANECDAEKVIASKSDEKLLKKEIQDTSGSGFPDQETSKTKIKRSKKLPTASESPKITSTNETPLELSSDQFIFKSSVPITEENYPILNSDKSQVFSQNCVVKNIYNYTFSDPAVKSSMKYPSVSKIIEDTMSDKNKQVLERWRQNMIKEMGEEGFYKHNEGHKFRGLYSRKLGVLRSFETYFKHYCKRKKSAKARGQEFHAAVLRRVLGHEVAQCSDTTAAALASLAWLLAEVTHPMAVESVIAHPALGYKGVFDCVALFRNIPVVIDWKLSDKPKKDLKDTYDAPVQVSAYIGAINHDPNYKWGIDHGLVAVAYTNGDPCDVFLLAPKHCQIYWKHWLMRLEKFKARSHLHLDHEIDEKALQVT